MARYYYDINQHPRLKYRRNVKKVLIAVFALFALICVYIAYDVGLGQRSSRTPSAPTVETTATFSPPVQFFRSEYFQFEASKYWLPVVSESTATKYVYRRFNKNLVESELDIYVNDTTAQPNATRVLPVTTKDDGTLMPTTISDNCFNSLKPPISSNPKMVTVSGISFLCNPNSAEYSLLVGLDSSSVLKLKRPNGTVASYQIFYNNFTFNPDQLEFTKLISTFQLR